MIARISPLQQACALIVTSCMCGLSANAQVAFEDVSDLLGYAFHSGIAVGVSDIDNDGYDDLLIMDQGTTLYIAWHSPDSTGFTVEEVGPLADESVWSMCAADLNNDGWLEIVTGGFYDNLKLTIHSLADSTWYTEEVPQSNIFVQGSNMADANNDGWLDLFACHDDGAPRLWLNDGVGLLFPAFDFIDFSTVPPSDNSGNYGSVWTDFDTDGDIDLYIAKCRQGVNNPEDARRINVLYENNGQSQYSEQAQQYGLRIARQSWTAEFQDIDNDGDFDALITNHDAPSQLLENRDGVFVDISTEAGFDASESFLQGIMRDVDNDGFVDILLASPPRLWLNNGDKTFTLLNIPPFTDKMLSLATGDLNHDGFLDVYVSKGNAYTNPSFVPDALWFNAGNDHHWLAFSLEGIASNKRGVGALIELHGPWGIQLREIRAGESYGIQNSLQAHFGLGSWTQADYVVVRWPSGIVDVWADVAADQYLHLVEGTTCQSDTLALSAEGIQYLCSGDTLSVSVDAPAGSTVLWNDGTQGAMRLLTQYGTYRAVVVHADGCVSPTGVVKVRMPEQIEPPYILVNNYNEPQCAGDTVLLTASNAELSVMWHTGDTLPTLAATQSGTYYLYYYQGACGVALADSVVLDFLPAPEPMVFPDTVAQGEPAVLTALSDGMVQWYVHPDSVLPVAWGDTLWLPQTDTTRTFWVASVYAYGADTTHVGMASPQGSLYSDNTFNGGVIFDCYTPFVLHSVRVFTDTYGPRRIELHNDLGEVVQALEVDIQSADTVLILDFEIDSGSDYLLTTNANFNVEHLGYVSPRLQRSDEGVQYPYEVEGLLSIHDSPFGQNYYYYFYDWEVYVLPRICQSQQVPVQLVVLSPTATTEAIDQVAYQLWPNPTSDYLRLRLVQPEWGGYNWQLRMWDSRGVLMEQQHLPKGTDWQIDVSHLPKGIYFLKLQSAMGQVIAKVALH